MAKRAVDSSSVPYFARFVPARRPGAPAELLPFVANGSRGLERVIAVLMIVCGPLVGLAVAVAFILFCFVTSFGDPPDGAEIAVAVGSGLLVAAGVTVVGVLAYRYGRRPSGIAVAEDHLEIVYKTFEEKLVVPRSAVRVVDIHGGSAYSLSGGARFPVDGPLPEGAFADALDNYPAAPWDDIDPGSRPVPWDFARTPGAGGYGHAPGADEYAHDDPAAPGWASGARLRRILAFKRGDAHLWSRQGSSLPFLRCGPGDIPNVAIVFNTPQRAPRPPWWYDLLPGAMRVAQFRGGREVRGFVMRMRSLAAAREAFSPWDVVRPVTAGDVLDEGILIAKPLAGKRAIVYTVLVVGPMVFGLIQRLLR
jgi:hypothetical protein